MNKAIQVYSAQALKIGAAYQLPWTTDPRVVVDFIFEQQANVMLEGTAYLRDIQGGQLDRNNNLIKHLLVYPQYSRVQLSNIPYYKRAENWVQVINAALIDQTTIVDLFPVYEGQRHGLPHAKRVVRLISYLAILERQNLGDFLVSALAAVIHDIGRTAQNLFDDHHGDASVNRLYQAFDLPLGDVYQLTKHLNQVIAILCREHPELTRHKLAPFDVTVLTEAVAAHSLNDPTARFNLAKKSFLPSQYQRILRMTQVLQDAVSLDRVRFGDNLDIRYLHTKHAKRLLKIAHQEVLLSTEKKSSSF